MEIKLTLTSEEIGFVLQAIGQLPTSSGSWPLLVKIRDQANSQAQAQSRPV